MALHDDKRADQIQRRQQDLAKARNLRIDAAIGAVAQTAEGREFLWWLLQVGKVNTQPFTTNALTTAFQCGELNVGNTIMERLIAVNPAIYVQMQQEHQNEYDQFVSAETSVEHSGLGGARPDTAGGYDNPTLD